MDMPTTLLDRALLSRTELHALVWAEPLRHLAGRFSISDQSLAKLCDRLDIPRPRPGHWNKVAAGKEIAVPALPPAKAGMDEKIEITRHPDDPLTQDSSAVFRSIAEVTERTYRDR